VADARIAIRNLEPHRRPTARKPAEKAWTLRKCRDTLCAIMDTLAGALPFHLEPGECFAGKYLIEGVLGSGGMSVVLAALHRGLQQKVAIKLLSAVHPLPPDGVRRFLREARAAAALRSEHTARVVDVDVDEAGRHFIVMEHLDGEDLGQALRREGALPIETAVGYVVHACEAMAEAHPLGIIHRDLKPQNLFLTRRIDGTPLVKVLDFGVSKFSSSTPSVSKASSLSTHNALLGTPHYMSPEQIRTPAEIDGRSDVWALGVILFELLTGQEPFGGATIPDVIAAVLQGTPASPVVLRAELPVELANVVLACLEKDVSERVQSMGQLAQLLLPWAPPWALEAAAAAERLSDGSPRASRAVPAGLVPADLVPDDLVPADLVPADLVPAGLIPAGLVPAGLIPAGLIPAGLLAIVSRARATARIRGRRAPRRRVRQQLPAYALAASCAVVGSLLVGSLLVGSFRVGSFRVGSSWFGVQHVERAVPEPNALSEPVSSPGEAPSLRTLAQARAAAPAPLPSIPEAARFIEASVVADEPPPPLAPARTPATKSRRTPRVQAPFPSDPLVGRR
jgi:eukaryotic-like serine/threonine-protein kinase